VRSADALRQLFGSQPCADRLAVAQIDALLLDMFAFIPAYAAFLTLGARALWARWPRLALAAIGAMLAAALLDELEDLILRELVTSWQSPMALFEPLFWTVRPKFALLGVGEMLLGVLMLRRARLTRIAAVPMLAGGAISLALLFAGPHDPWMMKAHTFAWTALLVVALIAAVRPTLAEPARRA